jgi:hypothetical protein
LGYVNPKEWTSDTRIFMRTRSSIIAAAGAKSHLPQLEVSEELVPFLGGKISVFFAGSLGPAAGDERPVV